MNPDFVKHWRNNKKSLLMLFHSDILTQSQEQEIKFKLVNFTKQKKKEKRKKENRK